MLVSEIGEFGLISLLTREFGIAYPPARGVPQGGLRVGLGDDAVVAARRDGSLILTTDTLVAGVHFLPERSNGADVGWKALAVNLSDVAAMGGTPHLALSRSACRRTFGSKTPWSCTAACMSAPRPSA